MVDLRDELDGYTVTFTSLVEDIDATPFMKGLPDPLSMPALGLRHQGRGDRLVRGP